MRSAHLLIFRLYTEMLNCIFAKMQLDIVVAPSDVEIFRIVPIENCFDTYYIMMQSKEFPLVQEGEKVKEGVIDFEKGKLTFRQKD